MNHAHVLFLHSRALISFLQHIEEIRCHGLRFHEDVDLFEKGRYFYAYRYVVAAGLWQSKGIGSYEASVRWLILRDFAFAGFGNLVNTLSCVSNLQMSEVNSLIARVMSNM